MHLDFKKDTLTAFNQTIPLKVTTSGHYSLPITPPAQIINDFDQHYLPQITLTLQSTKTKKEVAIKLHRQFAHATLKSLMNLIENADEELRNDTELHNEIENAVKNCETCQKYKKSPPRPIVGLPMATRFQEIVAMDLKFYQGNTILHVIDHLTRLSNAILIPDKQPKTIINALLTHWIAIYGSSEKFLFDNGGEFANEDMINMAERFGITIKTTAAESPWSNGLVERHNQILANMLNKVIDDTKCGLEIALVWCVNAKNSLANVHGFSPYQLALGYNPKLPSVIHDKPPALTHVPTSKILAEHLHALHSAREAFVSSENSEKIKRALSHNTRTSNEIRYTTGDIVYYKRNTSQEWRGPGSVIGQDGQQILIKHGITYVRVHPCRAQLVESMKRNNNLESVKSSRDNDPQTTHNQSTPQLPSSSLPSSIDSEDSDDDSDNLQHQLPDVPPDSDSSDNTQSDVNNDASPLDINVAPSSSEPTSDNITVSDPVTNTENVGENENASGTTIDTSKIHVGSVISYKDPSLPEMGEISATILSRGGKSKGKNNNWWNTISSNGEKRAINIKQMQSVSVSNNKNGTLLTSDQEDTPKPCLFTSDQENLYTIPDEENVTDTFLSKEKEKDLDAKIKELASWKDQQVYSEIDDEGQETMSLRWVIKDKTEDNVTFQKSPTVRSRI